MISFSSVFSRSSLSFGTQNNKKETRNETKREAKTKTKQANDYLVGGTSSHMRS
jgi:hypothetical protein